MSKKAIYGESYTMERPDKKEVLEAHAARNSTMMRVKRLGVLLKNEKTRSQEFQRQVTRLREENRRLKELHQRVVHLEEENQQLRDVMGRRSR